MRSLKFKYSFHTVTIYIYIIKKKIRRSNFNHNIHESLSIFIASSLVTFSSVISENHNWNSVGSYSCNYQIIKKVYTFPTKKKGVTHLSTCAHILTRVCVCVCVYILMVSKLVKFI